MTRLLTRGVGAVLGTALLVSGIAAVAPTAEAAAAGCTVNRYPTPPSIRPNTGSASCMVLNNGSRVRVVVTCSAVTIGRGPWVSTRNRNSVFVCSSLGSGNYPFVDFQTG
jgi:hypothetical protein